MSDRRARVVVAPDPSALIERMAGAIVGEIGGTEGRFSLVLAGGNTPAPLYARLATTDIPWSRLDLFFGDERAVPHDDPLSNAGMVDRVLTSKVRTQVFPMPAFERDPAAYESAIRAHVGTSPEGVPVFDLVLLGIGTDGHIASLFPGSPALERTDVLACMAPGPPPATLRMTLTLPVIRAAKRIWVLATGASKVDVLGRIFHGDRELPATRLQGAPAEIVWWLDRAAAREVRESP